MKDETKNVKKQRQLQHECKRITHQCDVMHDSKTRKKRATMIVIVPGTHANKEKERKKEKKEKSI